MLERGSQIGGYRIERLVGRGGMGEVYEATQLALGRTVALKVLHTNLLEDDEFRERFRREGKLQAQLEHPHVVTVYEAGEIPEGLFLAMRFIRGATLKDVIVAEQLNGKRAMSLLEPVADALDTAHRLSLVHRDVKPQNILVGAGDHPFLADFGLTRGSDESGLTRSGQFVGTLDYISPEQVRGEQATTASDIYALSAVLYECLTGTVPYPRPSDAAVLYAHVSADPPRVTASRADLPSEIDEVVTQGMAKEPGDRPERASDLMNAAASILTADPAIAARRPARAVTVKRREPPPTVRKGSRTVAASEGATKAADREPTTLRMVLRGRGRGLAVAGGVAVLALGAFALGTSGGDESSEPPLATSATSGAVGLRAPTGWQGVSPSRAPEVEGLELKDQIGLARGRETVLAGLTEAKGASLLPTALRSDAPKPDPVQLGEFEALRYRDLASETSAARRMDLYAVPTTAGVATVACLGPRAASRGGCERIAQSLELVRGEGYSLGQDAPSTLAADRITDELRRRRSTLRKRLAQARTNEGQTRMARSLGDAYGRAARQVGAMKVSPMVADRFEAAEAALAKTDRAYRGLASAARSQTGGAYRRATAAVRREEARVSDRLAALGKA